MAGYPISQLKKATEIKGQDILPIQQDGVTKQIEKSILDQATIIAGSGSQSSGIIRKEGTFVLTSGTLTNFTIENAVGRKPVENEYVDDAQLAAGMKVYVFNNASIQHTVIHGANSWPIAAGETLCFYWTGSRFTLHNVSVQNVTVRGDTKLTNVSALQSLATTNKIPVIGTDNVVKYTTPAAITDGYAKTTEVNNALTNYQKMGEYTFKLPPTTETTYLYCPIRNNATDGMIDWYLRSNKDNQIWSIKVTSWYRTEGQDVPAVVVKSNASRGLNITEIKGLFGSYWGGCQIALAIPSHSEEIELSTFCIHKGRIFIPNSFILLSDISSFTTVATKTITTGFNA